MFIERAFYVAIGAADATAERLRTHPAVQKVRERQLIEQIRELEPKTRKQLDDLQRRGERVIGGARERAEKARQRARALPEDTRKRVEELRSDAQKQASELRVRAEKTWDQLAGNVRSGGGRAERAEASKTASKAS